MKTIAVVGVGVVLVIILTIGFFNSPDLTVVDLDPALSVPTSNPLPTEPSPFDIVEQDSVDSLVLRRAPTHPVNDAVNVNKATTDDLPGNTVVDWQLIRSEDELLELIDSINADPALLQLLMDTYRQELDPKRRENLSSILGLVGGEQVTLLASELIFSGDATQRAEGMDLLQAVQPGNPMAREIVSGMLATEVDSDVLIDALTALAKPGPVDDQSRAWLSEQVSLLANHDDESVRGISLGILSRWADGSAHTDILVSALDDTSQHVRTAAVYALHDHVENPALVVERLFSVLENTDEHLRVRSAALLSLKSQQLTPVQWDQLERLELELNTRPRRR